MVIRRVGPLSCAKIGGTLNAVMGLIAGGMFSLVAIAGGFGAADSRSFLGPIIGAGSIIVLPIVYGCFGFIGGLIGAVIYNVVSSVVGGVEVDMQ